jgi:hypothetical protein
MRESLGHGSAGGGPLVWQGRPAQHVSMFVVTPLSEERHQLMCKTAMYTVAHGSTGRGRARSEESRK